VRIPQLPKCSSQYWRASLETKVQNINSDKNDRDAQAETAERRDVQNLRLRVKPLIKTFKRVMKQVEAVRYRTEIKRGRRDAAKTSVRCRIGEQGDRQGGARANEKIRQSRGQQAYIHERF
jgi:hypothetical protein